MLHLSRSLSLLSIPALLAASGCAQIIGIDDLPDPPGAPDGGVQVPDAAPGAPDASPSDAMVATDAGVLPCTQWEPRPAHFEPCDIPVPGPPLVLDQAGEYIYDTDSGVLTAPGGAAETPATTILAGSPEVRLVSVENLFISAGARLRAVGARPLLLASWSEIVVAGEIDVSSRSGSRGAGANTGPCATATEGDMDNDGAGGGGGGGFNGFGGQGGTGNGGNGGLGGLGGGVVPAPAIVRGGCTGANGGHEALQSGPAGGAGGGGLQLTARSSISIDGRLRAGGAGGSGARNESGLGGGGGGSGGMIGLEAPLLTIDASAVIAANGGGGGEGNGTIGNDGQDGRPDATAAAGGSGGNASGGDGGDGGALVNVNGVAGSGGLAVGPGGGGGGGGGGGSSGFIIFDGTQNVDSGATLSPEPFIR
jgi:hypothetical protein